MVWARGLESLASSLLTLWCLQFSCIPDPIVVLNWTFRRYMPLLRPCCGACAKLHECSGKDCGRTVQMRLDHRFLSCMIGLILWSIGLLLWCLSWIQACKGWNLCRISDYQRAVPPILGLQSACADFCHSFVSFSWDFIGRQEEPLA